MGHFYELSWPPALKNVRIWRWIRTELIRRFTVISTAPHQHIIFTVSAYITKLLTQYYLCLHCIFNRSVCMRTILLYMCVCYITYVAAFLLAQLIATEIMIPHINAHTVTFYVNLSPPSGAFEQTATLIYKKKNQAHFIYIFSLNTCDKIHELHLHTHRSFLYMCANHERADCCDTKTLSQSDLGSNGLHLTE